MIPLMLLSVFLILVILVQRGRGGGLTGALGGMGGQSAFGTKAGDLFTRITIVVAAIWVLLSMASLKVLNQYSATAGLIRSQRGQPTPAASRRRRPVARCDGCPSRRLARQPTTSRRAGNRSAATRPPRPTPTTRSPPPAAADAPPAPPTPPPDAECEACRRRPSPSHFDPSRYSESAALLLSMTGHGEAHRHEDGLSIAVEIRTVNNRYFKLNLRLTDGYAPLEPHVEAAVRAADSPRHGAGQCADRPRAAARRLSPESGGADGLS